MAKGMARDIPGRGGEQALGQGLTHGPLDDGKPAKPAKQ